MIYILFALDIICTHPTGYILMKQTGLWGQPAVDLFQYNMIFVSVYKYNANRWLTGTLYSPTGYMGLLHDPIAGLYVL